MNRHAPPSQAVAVCIDTRDGSGRKRLYGVAQYAQRQGWRTMLIRRSGREAAQEVVRLRPAGIIAYIANRWLAEAAHRLAVPLVDTAIGDVEVPMVVSLDPDGIGRLAAEHFLGLGLEHFAYCGVRGPISSCERHDSFAAHLAPRGHKLHAFAQGVHEGESRIEPLIRWLQGLPKPVGVLAYDDSLGERLLTACRWGGLSVPAQIAVLGIGNDELMCEVSWPSLSSISLPIHRLGFQAAEMLDQAMAGRAIREPFQRVLPTGVEVRASTDMLAVDDAMVKAAVRFIREHAGESIGIKHIARALDISRRTLDRRFADVLGRTVHEELTAVRMQMARNLLTGPTSIAAIARGCGYTTSASFSRAFRQHVGCWPTDYRNEARLV
ncbi:MAG: DNA-binding transcriptional regulator [Thermoguttaceae bacterium]|jgi:LacI family transcriptional regulator